MDPGTDSFVLGEIGRAHECCQHASSRGCELARLAQPARAGISVEDRKGFIGPGTDENESDESQEGTA